MIAEMISEALRALFAPVGATLLLGTSALAAHKPVLVGSIPAGVPTLERATALGVLVRIDPRRNVGEFRISCGWHYSPKTKVRRGLWKVSLRGLAFGWESNLADRAAGHVETVSLDTWERRAELRGWYGTLTLPASKGNLSNGPTTNVCGGVLG